MTDNITPHNPLEGERPELSINLHDGSEEQIAIIIVHKDRPEYLNMALQSVAVTSFNNNYELIVVDNGSTTKDSLDFLEDLQQQKEVKVIRNEKNLYWSAACNKGAAAADKNTKYYIFMHCDVIITNPAWLDLLINVSESKKVGMIG
jgi:GT2 family glycosyltransferase